MTHSLPPCPRLPHSNFSLSISPVAPHSVNSSRPMKDKISRGIPSAFSDLESLYAVIEELIQLSVKNLRDSNKFEDSESPSSFMYAAYFAAQHFDHLSETHRHMDTTNTYVKSFSFPFLLFYCPLTLPPCFSPPKQSTLCSLRRDLSLYCVAMTWINFFSCEILSCLVFLSFCLST